MCRLMSDSSTTASHMGQLTRSSALRSEATALASSPLPILMLREYENQNMNASVASTSLATDLRSLTEHAATDHVHSQNVGPLHVDDRPLQSNHLPSLHYIERGMEGLDLKRKAAPTGSPSATPPLDDGFTKVEKRKKKRLDKHRPQFQYDTSYFRTGKKIGIAVSNRTHL